MMYGSKHGSCQHRHKGHGGSLGFLQELQHFPKEKKSHVVASLRGCGVGAGLGHPFLSQVPYGKGHADLSFLLRSPPLGELCPDGPGLSLGAGWVQTVSGS